MSMEIANREGKNNVDVGREAGQILIAAIASPDSIFPVFSYGTETYSDLAKLREAGIFRETPLGLAISAVAKKSGARFSFDEAMIMKGHSVHVTIQIAGRTVVISEADRATVYAAPSVSNPLT